MVINAPMPNHRALGGMLMLCMLGVSCSDRTQRTAAFGAMPNAPHVRNPLQEGGLEVAPGSNVKPPRGFTPEEDIVFTDPDDPDASLPELSSILTDPSARRGPWEKDFTLARRVSSRQGRPLMIWFTHTKRSPRCRQLDQELFGQSEFQQWASRELIRMRVDEGEEFDDSKLSLGEAQTLRVNHAAYVKRLKNHYKILGYPSVILLDPTGRMIGHYRGFKKGEADLMWGRLKQAVAASAHAHKQWRAGLEARGYREWRDRKGRSVFAKLTRYDEGKLTLIEPDGTRSKTHQRELSDDDRKWLMEQKARHQR